MNDLPEPITTGRPGRGRWRTRLGLGLGGLAIGLLMAEVILWSSDLPQFPQPHSFPPQFMLVGRPDQQGWVHHVNKPSETIRFVYDGNPRGYFGPDNEVDHVTNSLGFRGDEFPLREKADGSIEAVGEKPAETVRVVFLGDSVTFGEGVKQKDSFVEQAAARLRETWKPEGRRLEVYNLGVGGHNTGDAAWTWQRYGHQLEPDVIVLGFVLNDAEPGPFRVDPVSGGPTRVPRKIEAVRSRLTGPPIGTLYHSRLARLFWQYRSSEELTNATLAHYRRSLDPAGRGWQSCLESITALRATGPPLVVVIFPLMYRLQDHPFQDVHRRLVAVCDPAHVVDLAGAFGKHGDERQLWVHPADPHPNESAHAIAGRRIATSLAGILSPASPGK